MVLIMTLRGMLQFMMFIIVHYLILIISKISLYITFISLILREGPTFGINGSFGSAEKKFDINFSKIRSLLLNCNGDNSYLFANGQEIFRFKANKKNVKFPTQFYLGSISHGFSAT